MYNIVKTINGHREGQVLYSCGTIEDARKALSSYMAGIDHGGDDRYIHDEEQRQDEIQSWREVAELDGWDARSLVDKIESWTVPCIVNPDFEEVCNCEGDRFDYDNYVVEIKEESK